MIQELIDKNLKNLNWYALSEWPYYCVDCWKIFEWKDLYWIKWWELICYNCDSKRLDEKFIHLQIQ